jgi:hypothetical protein
MWQIVAVVADTATNFALFDVAQVSQAVCLALATE